MSNYLRNLMLWAKGFTRFREIDFKPGWSATSPAWWLLYGLDYGACVILLAGPVESVSRFLHRHRAGWVNDKVLDVIEVVDEGHGAESGPALWGSVESSRTVRLLVPACWLALIVWSI